MNSLPLLYHTAAAGNPVVLGLRLSTFTLGHAILLHRLESPFVRTAVLTADSVAITARVLSTPWRQSVRDLKSSTRKLEFFVWGLFALRKADWSKEAERLAEYMQRRDDKLQPATSEGAPLECPGPERILLVLTSIGLSEDTALDLPMADAERLVLTWMESQGHVKVLGENHERLKAHADAEHARIMAEWQAMQQTAANG